jgi:hypothetical protein
MPLQDEHRRRLTTYAGGHADDDVPGIVLPMLERVAVSPGANMLDDALLVTGRASDPGQRLEVPPALTRLKPAQDSSDSRAMKPRRPLPPYGVMCA